MLNELQLILTPQQACDMDLLKTIVAKKSGIANSSDISIRVIRKSIDARGHNPKVNMTVAITDAQNTTPVYKHKFHYTDVSNKQQIIIVGSGPAGLFAALRLIELGLKPIVLERGKMVSERKKDIALLNRNEFFDSESNYCFGEGGAGTFSDGKLYTRSKKRGEIQRILEIFHLHKAQDEILYEAHPHIGTDILPTVIKNMRQTILDAGGEIHFESKVTDLLLTHDKIRGVETSRGERFESQAVILATGHSARDIYELLHRKSILIEAKGFAVGVRVEHPQALIDQIQYHCNAKDSYLPPATYSLVQQVAKRGVYSFCMCPGGHIVPASTSRYESVVNGMSSSKRNSPFANSGIVVEIRPEDLTDNTNDCLCGLIFQQKIEQLAFEHNNGGNIKAPAQRLDDFVKNRISTSLSESSYLPGLVSSDMHAWLPEFIRTRLQEGFKAFDRRMHGFLTNKAVIVGVESRSSSPIRIPRDKNSGEHICLHGLFPCGEGSGYAGGITSSAIDGEWIAEKVAEKLNKKV